MAKVEHIPSYKKKYLNDVRPHLVKKFNLKSMMEAPKIQKIFNRRNSKDNKLELKEYGVGAQILLALGLHKIILLSNSNKKIIALEGFDLEIVAQEKI